MKVTKIKNRVLKESVNQLLEGTGNFYYENVCLLVTDEDYETGNYPAYEDRPINGNNNFPQYPLVDWNDDLCFWQIVMTPGYYEHACIDYVEVDCDDIYNDILYDAEHNIDNYAFEDGKWTYEDAFMRHRGEDPEEHPEEDVIRAVREWVFSDYPIIADEDIKQALERYKKDGYYAPSVFLCDSSIINKIEQQLREKEVEICEQRINEIAKEYGFRKLGTVARFSNGETWYDYIDESLNEDENKDNTDSDFEIEDGILKKYTGNEANVVIPDSVTSIGKEAFYNCNSLTSIDIPNSVTSIGDYTFDNCTSLENVIFEENSKLTSIGVSAFYNCTSLISIKIPDSVTSIGDWAFRKCKSLTSIAIPNGITSIGEYTFNDCYSLTSVTIGDSVTSIGVGAFESCHSLTSIEIPNSVKYLKDHAFAYCRSLRSITYNGTVYEWDNVVHKYYTWDRGVPATEITCTDGVIRYEFKSRYSLDGPNKIRLRNTISEGSQEKVYAQALKTEQPLNNTELSALISDKVDEWIADGRITLNTTFNDVEKMFRDEISKSANDIFVVKTFDIVKKRYLDGVKG